LARDGEHHERLREEIAMRPSLSCPSSIRCVPVALFVATLISMSPAAQAAEVAWGTTTSAPAGARAEMFGVAAAGASDVWAVGAFNPGESPTAVLTRLYAQHWDGQSWTATPIKLERHYRSQSARLTGTAIVGPDDAWAVGHVDNIGSLAARSLAYRWNGTRWRPVPTPRVAKGGLPDRLQAVTSLAADDAWAVGETGLAPQEHSLALHWDGAAWTRQATPDIGGLVAVTADAGALWVAGSRQVMQRPAGGDWKVLPPLPISGNPGALQLFGVAVAAGRAWAVGTVVREFGETVVFSPYAAWRDSGEWHDIVVDEAGAELTGVTVRADGTVIASGFDGTVVRLTTSGDRHEVTPAAPHAATLDAIAADPAGRAWSVGAVYAADGTPTPWLLTAPGIGQGGIGVTTGYGQATVSWFGPVDGSGLADSGGFFDVGGLPTGKYSIIATGAGCTPGQAQVRVREGVVVEVEARVEC
jgi:hypothetical protein